MAFHVQMMMMMRTTTTMMMMTTMMMTTTTMMKRIKRATMMTRPWARNLFPEISPIHHRFQALCLWSSDACVYGQPK